MPSALPELPFVPGPLQKLWAKQMHQAYLLLRWALLQLLHLAVTLEARLLHWKNRVQQAAGPRAAWAAKVLPWPLCQPFAWLLPEPLPRSGKAPGPPQTIAIVLAETFPIFMPLPKVADLVGWCASMGLTHIILYDPEGHMRSAHVKLGALLRDPDSFTCGAYSYHVEVGYETDGAAGEDRVSSAAARAAAAEGGVQPARAKAAREIQVRLLSGRDAHALLLAAARKGAPPHCAPWPGSHTAFGRSPKPALLCTPTQQPPPQQQRPSMAETTPSAVAGAAQRTSSPFLAGLGPEVAVMNARSSGSSAAVQSPQGDSMSPGYAQRSRLATSSVPVSSEPALQSAPAPGAASPGAAAAEADSRSSEEQPQQEPPSGVHAELPAAPAPQAEASHEPSAAAEASGRGVISPEEGSRRRSVGGPSSVDGGGPIRRARARRGNPRSGGGPEGGHHKPKQPADEDEFASFIRHARQGGVRADCTAAAQQEPNHAIGTASSPGGRNWSIPVGNGAAADAATFGNGGPGSLPLVLATPAANGIAFGGSPLASRPAQSLDTALALSSGGRRDARAVANGTHASGTLFLTPRPAQSLDSSLLAAVSRPRSAGALMRSGSGGRAVSWAKEGRLFSTQSELSADSLLSAFNSQLAAQGVSAPTPPLAPAELVGQMAAIAGAGAVAEPDLVLVFGRAFTLAGFPPWPLRFAEIYAMGRLPDATPQSLLDALKRYCRTSQRFGT